MEVFKKIKFMRKFKDFTQEDMAGKLEIATRSYAKIERGETELTISRLQQIANILNIELSQLFELNEKNVLNFFKSKYTNYNNNSYTECHNWQVSSFPEKQEFQHKLDKQQIIIDNKTKNCEFLEQRVQDLENMIELLKK
jgi:transcriptional regulator with XRE-family HTH domain